MTNKSIYCSILISLIDVVFSMFLMLFNAIRIEIIEVIETSFQSCLKYSMCLMLKIKCTFFHKTFSIRNTTFLPASDVIERYKFLPIATHWLTGFC